MKENIVDDYNPGSLSKKCKEWEERKYVIGQPHAKKISMEKAAKECIRIADEHGVMVNIYKGKCRFNGNCEFKKEDKCWYKKIRELQTGRN